MIVSFRQKAVTIGLAIFAMLFGASNLIFPPYLGAMYQNKVTYALIGFLITSVLLPLIGLIGITLFDGNHKEFFYRIGKIPGMLLMFASILIIGPFFAMPRITRLVYTMIDSNSGSCCLNLIVFSIFFGLITYILSYKPGKIVDIMGKFLSPIKLTLITTAIAIGLFKIKSIPLSAKSVQDAFSYGFLEGYGTLDLMAAIFFGYIILNILKHSSNISDKKHHTYLMLVGGLIGCSLLALIYISFAYIGAANSHLFSYAPDINNNLIPTYGQDEFFAILLKSVLGTAGSYLIIFTIFFACLSTLVALASVSAKYIQQDIMHGKIHYAISLFGVIIVSTLLSQFEFRALLSFYKPIIAIAYPTLIALTICNILYKLYGIKVVKIPVLLIFLISTIYVSPEIIGHFNNIRIANGRK